MPRVSAADVFSIKPARLPRRLREPGSFLWKVLLGILYIVFGSRVINQLVSGVLTLTVSLGLSLLASGVVRIFARFTPGRSAGWMMLLSGGFAVLAGLVVISAWPPADIRTSGLLLAIDLLWHGVAWLTLVVLPDREALR